ncbi:hypothetical protein XNC3_590008 [Xenorhabdus nematophila F1]|nr:hypothetical protein XNC3_590008 [Xenorhabdus nematophila F1]
MVTPGRGTPRLFLHMHSGLLTASLGNDPPPPLIGTPATLMGKIQLQQMSVISFPPITSAFWHPGSADTELTQKTALTAMIRRIFCIMVRPFRNSNVYP